MTESLWIIEKAILFYTGYRSDTEILDKHPGYIGAQKGGKCRPEMDVLHSQGKKCQQYYNGLLFIPCDVVQNRQVVDSHLQRFGEFDRHLCEGV